MSTASPTPLQYVAYAYGRRLPDSMRTWVAEDLAGHELSGGTLTRMAMPPFLVLAPLWLIPASFYVHFEMTAPIYIWAVLMSLALEQGLAPTPVGPARSGPESGRCDQTQERRAHPRGLHPPLRAAPGRGQVAVEQQPVLAVADWGATLGALAGRDNLRCGSRCRRRGRPVRAAGVRAWEMPPFVFTGNLTANLIRNVWSYMIIFCGHFPRRHRGIHRRRDARSSRAACGTSARSSDRRT